MAYTDNWSSLCITSLKLGRKIVDTKGKVFRCTGAGADGKGKFRLGGSQYGP